MMVYPALSAAMSSRYVLIPSKMLRNQKLKQIGNKESC